MLRRLEVWTDLECAGGTRKAFIPLDECISLSTTERTARDDEGECTIPKDISAYTHIAGGRVLRFLHPDGSFDEWRIQRITDTSRRKQTVSLTLRSPLMDLDRDGVLYETSGSNATADLTWVTQTPTQLIALILADAPSHWSAGTITPTALCSLNPSGWTRLRALRELVSAIRKQGVAAELDFRRDGTTGYLIDIVTEIGGSASTLDVRTAKNLLSTDRDRDHEKYAAEVIPLGAGTPRAMIDRAYWECTAKSGATLTMQQPVTGGRMIAFDDQFNAARYLVDDAGDEQQITDTLESTQQIVIADATDVTANRWYRVVADSSGTPLIGLRRDPSLGSPSLPLESQLDGALNLVANPSMRDWASTIPDNWTHPSGAAGTGTYTKETTTGLWLTAGQSLYMKNASGGTAMNVRSPLRGQYIPTDWKGKVIFSLWIRVKKYGNLGTLRMQAWRTVGGIAGAIATKDITSATYPLDQWHRVDIEVALASGMNAFQQFAVSLISTAVDTNTLEAECYLDSVMVDVVPEGGSARSFIEGCNPSRLWSLGNQYLLAYGVEPITYRATFADLGLWSPDDFPYDEVHLGQQARVRDTDLDLSTTARVLEVRRDWRNPLASTLTVSSRPEDLVSRLTGILAGA